MVSAGPGASSQNISGHPRREGLDPHRTGGTEQVTGVTLQRHMVSQEVTAHSHTHRKHQMFSGLHVYMASLKKRPTLIFDVYISHYLQ